MAVRLIEAALLDLERCSFLRPLEPSPAAGADPPGELGCFAAGGPVQIGPAIQRERCATLAHARCPALLEALAARPVQGWAELGRSARVVAEACRLAEARLEAQAERMEIVLNRIFGPDA